MFALLGGLIGSLVGGLFGGAYKALGYLAGSLIGAFMEKPDSGGGVNLGDIQYPSADYGTPIKKIWGRMRVGSGAIWASGIRIINDRDEKKQHQDQVYTRWAVLICDGPIKHVTRVWLDNKLVLDLREGVAQRIGSIMEMDENGFVAQTPKGVIRIYFGTETQSADPLMSYYDGVSGDNTPAYRGEAIAVFESNTDNDNPGSGRGFNVTAFGNGSPPASVFEVIQSSDEECSRGWQLLDTVLPDARGNGAVVSMNKKLWVLGGEDDISTIFDPITTVDDGVTWREGYHNCLSKHAIVGLVAAVDAPGGKNGFWITGDITDTIQDSQTFHVVKSPGNVNDGTYTIFNSTTDGSHSIIEVDESIPSMADADASGEMAIEMPRQDFVAVKIGDPDNGQYCLVAGGRRGAVGLFEEDSIYKFSNGMWGYIEIGSTGDSTTDLLFFPRYSYGAVGGDHSALDPTWYVQNQNAPCIYLTGGYKMEEGVPVAQNDLWIIQFSDNEPGVTNLGSGLVMFEKISDDCLIGSRYNHTMVNFNGSIYVVGGVCTSDASKSNGCYLLGGTEFEEKTADLTGGADNGTVIGACAHNGNMYALVNDNRTNAVELFSTTDGTTWTNLDVKTKPQVYDSDMRPMFLSHESNESTCMYLIGGGRSGVYVDTVYRFDEAVIEASTLTLADLLDELCQEVGIAAGDIDVTDATIAATEIKGFVRKQQESVLDEIAMLRQAYFFDMYETADIVFRARGSASVKTLTAADLAYVPEGRGAANELVRKRLDPYDFPLRIEVSYYSDDNNYLIGTQSDQRMATNSKRINSVSLPLLLTDDEAARISEILLEEAWLNQQPVEIQVKNRHIDLVPTDVITLNLSSGEFNARVRQIQWEPGQRLRMPLIVDDIDYASARSGGATLADTTGVRTITTFFDSVFLDCHIIDPADDDWGFYFAITGSGGDEDDTESGVHLYQSSDGGSQYFPIKTAKKCARIGETLTQLQGNGANQYVRDIGNTVTVRILNGSLETITEDQLRNGSNTAIIGDEIIRFMTVTASGDDFILSDLYRGCFGTESFIETHSVNDRFVLMVDEYGEKLVHRVELPRELKDKPLHYKVCSLEVDDPDSEKTVIQFTNTCLGQKPYAVTQAEYETILSGNQGSYYISWSRRHRLAGEWWDAKEQTIPGGERYEIDFIDSNDEVKRIKEVFGGGDFPLKQPYYEYPIIIWSHTIEGDYDNPNVYADIAEFVLAALSDSFTATIYEVSDYGRGYPISLTITPS